MVMDREPPGRCELIKLVGGPHHGSIETVPPVWRQSSPSDSVFVERSTYVFEGEYELIIRDGDAVEVALFRWTQEDEVAQQLLDYD